MLFRLLCAIFFNNISTYCIYFIREDTRRTLQAAEKELRDAESKTSGVLAAERGLLKQEREISAREIEAEEIRVKYFNAKKVLQKEAVKLIAMQKELNAERFRLHGAAMKLSSQASEVRHSIGLIARYGRLTSIGYKGMHITNMSAYLCLFCAYVDMCVYTYVYVCVQMDIYIYIHQVTYRMILIHLQGSFFPNVFMYSIQKQILSLIYFQKNQVPVLMEVKLIVLLII